VLNGITGSVGLAPTLAALESGSRLILANKESLIVGGALAKRLAAPGQIIPVDSEHSALFQCLQGGKTEEVRRLIVTASGGPFRGRTRAEMADVTAEQALAHPVWNMGPVITVNCANLVNKGLEVIEAHLLFDIPFDRIEVVVHPQVMVHSMVEFHDGSTLAQVAPPDIRMALALGMSWPDRVPDAAPACDWTRASSWDFLPVDHDAFPGLGLACAAGEAGGNDARGVQRRQRGVRRGLPRRAPAVPRDHRHGRTRDERTRPGRRRDDTRSGAGRGDLGPGEGAGADRRRVIPRRVLTA
jgi:1-deoxy-D-xylulose-5-phosphate reductoisomerase